MASLSNQHKRGYRIQWRFVVRVGPRAGENVSGSLLLGRCTRAAAKARLRDIDTWEEAVKTGRHLPDTSWQEVKTAWLDERALTSYGVIIQPTAIFRVSLLVVKADHPEHRHRCAVYRSPTRAECGGL